MKTKYKILGILGAIVGLALLAVAFLPWKTLVAQKLQTVLEARGLEDVHLIVSEFNFRGVILRDITIGGDNPVTLKNVVMRFSPLDLLRRTAGSEVTLNSDDLLLEGKKLKIGTGKAEVHAKLSGQGPDWEGTWRLRDIKVVTDAADVPALAGEGTMKTVAEAFLLDGKFHGGDFNAAFKFEAPFAEQQKPRLTLVSAAMPWNDGKLTVQNVLIPLGGNQPVKLALQVQRVSLDALIQALTGNRVSATGAVSGTLPMTIGWDGSFSFGAGDLRTSGPGTLTMPPEAIPGDNEQVAMVREILKNFHYNDLSIAISNNKGNQISLLVALQGNNPDMYNGRPVKLNVRLAGDVLGYIKQNLTFLTDPETMLKELE